MFPRFTKLLTYILIIYTILGFIVLPLVLKSQLVKLIEANTNSKVTLESVYFNPFVFKLELNDLGLSSRKNELLFSFKKLSININPSSMVQGAVHLKELLLVAPKINLVYTKEKKINLLTLLKEDTNSTKQTPDASEKTSTNMPRIIVERVVISDGGVEYKDFTHKDIFEFSFNNIGFTLKDIDTKDSNKSDAKLRFYSTLGDGGFIDFNSNIRALEPLKVDGSLDFEASKLYTEWKYIKEQLKLEVADGKISFYTDFAFNLDDINATLLNNLSLNVENLRIKPKEKVKDVLNLEKFSVTDVTIRPMMQDIKVSKVTLNNLSIKAKRDSRGTIDWIEYTKTKITKKSRKKPQEKKVVESKSRPWSLLVNDIALKDISLDFYDAMIKPKVNSKISKLNLYMQDVTLLGEKPFQYQIDMLLNKKAKLTASGEIKHKDLDITSLITLSDFDIVHYKPYIDTEAAKSLAIYNLNLRSLALSLHADAKIYKEKKETFVQFKDTNINLKKFRVDKKSTREKLVYFNALDIKGIELNTKSKEIDIAEIQLKALGIKARKYKNKKLNFDKIIVAKKSKKVSKRESKVKKLKPYNLSLKHFALRNSAITFTDDSLSKRTINRVDRVRLDAYNIKNKKKSWLKYKTSLRVNSQGFIKAEGKLRHTPLKQRGKFTLKNIALKDINPYMQEKLYTHIDDGKLSLKGTTEFEPSSKEADLRVKSSFNLSSLFINDARDNALLLSLQEVATDSFTLELSPNRFYMNELDINSFYVNAMINEKRELNFSKLIKKQKDKKIEKKENISQKVKEAFPYQIAKVNVAFGSAKFADYSIPIKFKTHIHDLDGVIYSISNLANGTSYINISGEVDKYGSTRLKGSVDSAKPKDFTDLTFSFKNLDLNSVSGYSASFAGYKIDSGKLYLDLDYDIVHSELLGKNSVIMKKVVLGDSIEDENVTHLPLGFVLGLLEDSDGVVDLNMDVAGNVDAPDFKYGPLVFKAFTNLIMKAVTSPFKFLGSVMGFDADKLENLNFEVGESLITPPEREKLDQIAKIMLKKPKISLKITPSYNSRVDKESIQLNKLIDLVMQKSGLKNRKEHESAMNIDLLEDIYEDMRDDDALDELEERVHQEVDEKGYERAYHDALVKLCRDIQPIEESELKTLAKKRAESITSYLEGEKFISKERIKVADFTTNDAEDERVVVTKMEIVVE